VPRRPNVERGTETGSASALAVQPLGLSVICRRDTPSTPSSFHRTQSHATHCHWAANSQYGSRGPNNLCCKSHCKSDDMMALLTPGRFLVRRDRATLTCCILTTTVLQDPSVASAPLPKTPANPLLHQHPHLPTMHTTSLPRRRQHTTTLLKGTGNSRRHQSKHRMTSTVNDDANVRADLRNVTGAITSSWRRSWEA
jgi:hypothetical protein